MLLRNDRVFITGASKQLLGLGLSDIAERRVRVGVARAIGLDIRHLVIIALLRRLILMQLVSPLIDEVRIAALSTNRFII